MFIIYCLAFLKYGIMDTLALGEVRGLHASKGVSISNDFRGSDCDVQCRFMDAMALVARYGWPDYFIIMTCNSYWSEIIELLLPGQTPKDKPDIVARVYHAKLLDLHDFLIKKVTLEKFLLGLMLQSFGKEEYHMNTFS
jgi:hypothetical protein